MEGGHVSLIDTIVSDNSASANGGGYKSNLLNLYASGATRFSGNHAGLAGGGIYQNAHGKATLGDTVSVDHNTAGQDGGGIVIADGNVFLNDEASIHHNTAGRDGGGVWSVGAPGVLYLNDRTSISDNTAAGSGGGAFLTDMSFLSMAGTSSISRNTAAADGGGAWVCASGCDLGHGIRARSATTPRARSAAASMSLPFSRSNHLGRGDDYQQHPGQLLPTGDDHWLHQLANQTAQRPQLRPRPPAPLRRVGSVRAPVRHFPGGRGVRLPCR